MEILLFLDTIEQGLIYGIVVLGVYLSFRILNYADFVCGRHTPFGGCRLSQYDCCWI
jgi:putative ABC transport system permease protein